MYVLLANIVANFSPLPICLKKVHNVEAIFQEQLIYPGQWQLMTMAHSKQLMSYDLCTVAKVLQQRKK